MTYFSERETGELPRVSEEISATVWRGLLTLIRSRTTDGSFGAEYPDICEDGTFTCGTDRSMFEDAMRAEIPSLAEIPDRDFSGYLQSTLTELGKPGKQPATPGILDLVEFCWKSVGKPMVKRESRS